jgi:hypothetical protein
MKSEDVTLAAIWDLLTMQCDRHGQNVYIDEFGHLTLIDLDQSFGDGWRICGSDSIFLPTTQKHAITFLGYSYVMKQPPKDPSEYPSTSAALESAFDYRCHAPGGVIGFNYPPKVEKCLRKISQMTYRQVHLFYTGIPVT